MERKLIKNRANEKIIMALLLHPGIQTNIGNNYMNTPFHCFCNKFSSPSSVSQVFIHSLPNLMLPLVI